MLILADDLGFSDLGCYGGEIRTPNLDGLAAERPAVHAVLQLRPLLPDAGQPAHRPVSAPGRRRPHDRRPRLPGYRGYLAAEHCVTIAEVAASRPATARSWSASGTSAGRSGRAPIDRGFDEFYGMIGGLPRSSGTRTCYTRLPAGRPKRTYRRAASTPPTPSPTTPSTSSPTRARAGEAVLPVPGVQRRRTSRCTRSRTTSRSTQDVYAEGWDRLREDAARAGSGSSASSARTDAADAAVAVQDAGRLPPNRRQPGLGHARRRPPGRPRPAHGRLRRDGRPAWTATSAGVVDDLQQHGELDNTLILFLSDNGACAEWDPFGFDGAQRAEERPPHGRRARRDGRAEDVPQLRQRVGERRQHAVPAVQALLPRGRHPHAADRPLAEGDRRQGRIPRPGRARRST